MRRTRLRRARRRRRCGVQHLLFFFLLSLSPRILRSSRRVVVASPTGLLFFLFHWLYPPLPRVEERLERLLDHHALWSVCSPRGRNGADSLIPDDLVFAFAIFFLSFCHCIPRGVLEGREQDGREGEHGMGWHTDFRSTPAGFGFGLCDTREWGAIYIHTHYIGPGGFLFFVVGLFLVCSDGLYVVPCNLIRAALGCSGGRGLWTVSGAV